MLEKEHPVKRLQQCHKPVAVFVRQVIAPSVRITCSARALFLQPAEGMSTRSAMDGHQGERRVPPGRDHRLGSSRHGGDGAAPCAACAPPGHKMSDGKLAQQCRHHCLAAHGETAVVDGAVAAAASGQRNAVGKQLPTLKSGSIPPALLLCRSARRPSPDGKPQFRAHNSPSCRCCQPAVRQQFWSHCSSSSYSVHVTGPSTRFIPAEIRGTPGVGLISAGIVGCW